MKLALRINGEAVECEAPAQTLLLDLLRERGLTGSKEGCGVGVCGACTVLVDGDPVSSCLFMAACADGREVWTAEGLARSEPGLAAAFVEREAMQCGICTPGQFVSACALLRHQPAPSEGEVREFMSGNLCRCTGYATIVEAILAAARGRV